MEEGQLKSLSFVRELEKTEHECKVLHGEMDWPHWYKSEVMCKSSVDRYRVLILLDRVI